MMKRIVAIIMVMALVMGNNMCALASEIGDAKKNVSEESDTKMEEDEELGDEATINVTSIEEFQSAHPYEDYEDTTWIYTQQGAEALEIQFSDECMLEDGYDFVQIYDSEDIEIGIYTNDELLSSTIYPLASSTSCEILIGITGIHNKIKRITGKDD